MKIEKLSEGVFATTPVYLGMTQFCLNDNHVWVDDSKPKFFPNDTSCQAQLQRCAKCSAARTKIFGDEETVTRHLEKI